MKKAVLIRLHHSKMHRAWPEVTAKILAV